MEAGVRSNEYLLRENKTEDQASVMKNRNLTNKGKGVNSTASTITQMSMELNTLEQSDMSEDDDDEEEEMIKSHGIQRRRVKKKHKKSRDSCTVCKERKIKCDQRVPQCSFCERKGIQCPYIMMTPFQIHRILEHQKSSKRSSSTPGSSIDTSESAYANVSTPDTSESNSAETPTNSSNYSYRTAGTINLNSQSPHLDRSNYQIHEIESALLPSSIGNEANTDTDNDDIYDYMPLKTNYILTGDNNNSNFQIFTNPQSIAVPLYSNSRVSNKTFNTSHNPIFRYYDEFIATSIKMVGYLLVQDFKSIQEFLGGKNIDFILRIDYLQALSISQIYNKLLRKSFLLFALDYYKNIILKQNMIPFANYKAKLSISCVCENESVQSIDEITKIIKVEYLPLFYDFSAAAVNLFLGSFMILDDCLGYHFKNGLKYDMNYEEGNRAIQLVGIFSTGYYSVVMERSREELLMSSTNILSAFLVTNFRRLLMKNYTTKIFDEFEKVVEKIKFQFGYDVNYENLQLFCRQQSNLLKVNVHYHSLIGFNNGFLIRLYNSFKAILPFDISNFSEAHGSLFTGRDLDIIIRLLYYTAGHILDAILPGLQSIVSGSFCGLLWDVYEFPNIQNLMDLFNSIGDRRLKIIAIFLIRTGLYFKCHKMYYRKYLQNYTIEHLLNEDSGLSIHQRYLRLLKLKEDGIVDQIPMKSFLLDKGQFIKRWNYPNDQDLKPKRTNRVWDNKIVNHFGDDPDAMIDDYIKSNNGFFTYDYDPAPDMANSSAVSAETTFIDGNQLKMLWKLSTYIRINNL